MTGAATVTERTFELHGVGVCVAAEEPSVIEAMELRLRDFRSQAEPGPPARFEFVADGVADLAPPRGAARPVYDTPHGTLHYFPDVDILTGRLGGVELRCDAGHGVARLRSAAFVGRELYLATHPLATIGLMELFERRALFSLHAACVAGDDGRGVLLAGPSGAGKSTLALALAGAGLRFLSDDIVFLARETDTTDVRVLGFADAIGITAHAAEQFSELRVLLHEPPADGFPKRLARIEELFGAPTLRACEPHALVFPRVVPDRPSQIAPMDGGDALLRLVPDVLLTEPSATKAHLEAIAALLKQVRCYALRSGGELEHTADLVRSLI